MILIISFHFDQFQKEAALGTKMRQDAIVKPERNSSDVPSSKENRTKTSKENNPNTINVKLEKISNVGMKNESNERSSDPKKVRLLKVDMRMFKHKYGILFREMNRLLLFRELQMLS